MSNQISAIIAKSDQNRGSHASLIGTLITHLTHTVLSYQRKLSRGHHRLPGAFGQAVKAHNDVDNRNGEK
jgi:hypothetical protein